MSVFEALMARLGYHKAAPQAGALYPAGGSSSFIPVAGPVSWPGWRNQQPNQEARAKAALTSAWVYSCVATVAQEIGAATLIIKKREAEELTDVANHPLEILWQRPNPFMGSGLLKQLWAWQLLLSGESYLYHAPAGNEITELWPVPAWTMSPVPDPVRFIKGYHFRPRQDQPPLFIEPEYITYSRLPNPFDIRRGLSPLAAAALSVETDMAQARWNKDFFGAGNAVPPAIAILPKDVGESDFIRIRSELFDFFGGGQRRIAVARSGDLDFKMLALGQKDMDFIAGRAFSRDEIDRAFGFPGGYWTASATEANARHAKAALIENACWPKLVMLAEDLNAQMVSRWYGDEYVAAFDDIRPRNVELELRQSQTRQSHWTINELRREDGLKPLEGELWDSVPAAVASRIYQPEKKEAEEEEQSAEQQAALPPPPPESEGPEVQDMPEPETEDVTATRAIAEDLQRWQRKALKALKAGRSPVVKFQSEHIPPELAEAVSEALAEAVNASDVKGCFEQAFKADDLTAQEKPLADALSKVLSKAGAATLATALVGGEIAFDELDANLRAALLPAITQVMLSQAMAMANEIGLDFDPAQMQTTAGAWAAQYTGDLVKGISETTRKATAQAVSSYMDTPGMTRAQLEALLSPAFGATRAEMIAITEITRAANQATVQYQQELDKAGITMERVWRTNNDDMVCVICGPLNGKPEHVWSERFPHGAPAHPRCRCATTLRRKRKQAQP